tara:strand:+ start:358 stop:552 length:195 start_codon:yes stop_codon:yes gene_type:complete
LTKNISTWFLVNLVYSSGNQAHLPIVVVQSAATHRRTKQNVEDIFTKRKIPSSIVVIIVVMEAA